MSDHRTGGWAARAAPRSTLRELLYAKLESGEDLGALLAFNIDGEMIVDHQGNWAEQTCKDVDRERSQACSPPPRA